MFLSALGLATNMTIQTILSKSEGLWTTSAVSDRRGKIISSKKISTDISDKVNSHLLSFNSSIIHYRKKHAPNRLYISLEFNVSMMD